VFDTSIVGSVTAVAGTKEYFAIGSSQGRLVLFDSETSSPICQYADTGSHDLTRGESMALSADVGKRKSNNESMNITSSSEIVLTASEDAIVSMMFLNHDQSLLTIIARHEASLYLIDEKRRGRDVTMYKFPVQLALSALDWNASLGSFTCYDGSNIFGLFYKGGREIELFRIKSTALTSHTSEAISSHGLLRLCVEEHEIEVYECHAIRSNDSQAVIIYAFGAKIGNALNYGIFKAQVDLPLTQSSYQCEQIVYLQYPVRCIFSQRFCGIVESKNISVYDLLKEGYGSNCIYDLDVSDLMVRCSSFDKVMIAFQHTMRRGGERVDSIQIVFNHPTSMITCQLSTD
jgi:hypothetical protein